MQSSTTTDPQEENSTDLISHFKNLAQRFMNAYDDQNKGTQSTMLFHAQEIERLQIQKSIPDAPKEYILEAITSN